MQGRQTVRLGEVHEPRNMKIGNGGMGRLAEFSIFILHLRRLGNTINSARITDFSGRSPLTPSPSPPRGRGRG